jgi:uncharacterized protein (TIGR02301 family)
LAGALVLASIACPLAATAQQRGPAEHKQMLDLAYVLGQAHALRQACAPDDQMWRARMQRMIEVEAPEEAFEAQLATRFNDGFVAEHARFPKCDAGAAAAEAKVAEQGRKLALTLSRGP